MSAVARVGARGAPGVVGVLVVELAPGVLQGSLGEVLGAMAIAGLGSGALVAAPLAAVAPPGRTAVATGPTNTGESLGGAVAARAAAFPRRIAA